MNRRLFLQLAASTAAGNVFSRRARAQAAAGATSGVMTPVLTRAFDNNRTGANLNETVLTRDNVLQQGIRRLFTIPVYGDARGTESQPLILPSVKMVDGTTHDVVVLPSMANIVRGCDALTGAGLWSVTLGTPVNGGASIDAHLINDKWGVLSTGVIDPDTQRVYLVAWVSPDGTPQKAVHFVYVLNVADGSLVCPAVSLAGATSLGQNYSSVMRKQRSSLCMTNVGGKKTVFLASGTVLETGAGAAGWVFAFDCATNQLTAALAMSQGDGAGVWMGGQGLAADAQGFLYGVSGNGSFNGYNDFGECVFKLQYQPPTATAKATLKVVSRWAPYSDAGRIGQNPTLSAPTIKPAGKLAGVSAPTAEMQMPVNGMQPRALKNATIKGNLVYPKMNPNDGAYGDEDLGSAGGTLIERYGVYLAGGKDGIGYPVKTGNMGDTQPADFAHAKANCAKLAAPPVWLTASPGPVDPCPQDETTLNFLPWGKTRHMHSTPVQYMSPTHGMVLFVGGENSAVHAWGMAANGTLTYLAQGKEIASANVAGSPGGMPGTFMSLSSNNNAPGSAVLWASMPYGDANAAITNGRLLAYDPETFVKMPDGTQQLRVLWDSQAEALPYIFNKFMPPIVSGGRVFLPNYGGGVDVYGLA